MEPAEVLFLVGLLFIFYITIKHPFLVALIILLFITYIRFFAEKTQQQPKTNVKQFGKIQELNNTSHSNGQIGESPIKKSQREILAEVDATEPPPKEKFSKLILTYQVPMMTEYYEGLVQLIQN